VAALTSCVVVDEGPISPDPQYCPQIYAPVCARRGDDRRTFPNECYAEREGYYIIRDGECRRDRPDYPDSRPPRPPRPPQSDRPQACPMIYAPVCAQRGNDRRTFENSCQANAAGYGIIREGECRGDGGMRPPGGPGGSVPGRSPTSLRSSPDRPAHARANSHPSAERSVAPARPSPMPAWRGRRERGRSGPVSAERRLTSRPGMVAGRSHMPRICRIPVLAG
jgi:hypothetical protein